MDLHKMHIKGVKGKQLAENIKLSIDFDINMQLYFTEDSIKCFKQHLSQTCSKYWELPYSEIISNHEEISSQIKAFGQDVKLAITDLNQFIKSGLFIFKDDIDFLFHYNDSGFVVGELLMTNKSKLKIKHSTADGYTSFYEDLTWDAVDNMFSFDDARASFLITKDQLKKMKQLSKMNTIAGKTVEYADFYSKDGYLNISTIGSDWQFKESEVEWSSTKIQVHFVNTLADDDYKVFVKPFGNSDILIFESRTQIQKQAVIVLDDINTNISITDIESQIGSVSFEDFAEANQMF